MSASVRSVMTLGIMRVGVGAVTSPGAYGRYALPSNEICKMLPAALPKAISLVRFDGLDVMLND